MEHIDHVLIVDDDREIRELVSGYLKKNGLRATAVADTMLISASCGRRTPASAAAVRARVFISATSPAYSIRTFFSPVSVSCPANNPSCSASLMNGFRRGASSAVMAPPPIWMS